MILATGAKVRLRNIGVRDLKACAPHIYTLSITEPLTDPKRIREVYDKTGFWTPTSGAVAIETIDPNGKGGDKERLIGTQQFYGAGPAYLGKAHAPFNHSSRRRKTRTWSRNCLGRRRV